MPAPQPLPLSQADWTRLRDQFAVALAQARFTALPSYPGPDQRDAEARSIWQMADAIMRSRTPEQTDASAAR
jgi:hypothetical protein